MNWGQKVCLSIVLFAFSGDRAASATNQTHAAAVLFENFETVFHTTPALMSSSPSADDPPSYMREPFSYLKVGLQAVEKEMPKKVLVDSEAIFVGSKDFLPPSGLGSVRSTRCYVVVLRKEGTLDFSQYFNKPPVALVEAGPIWNWSADLGEFGEEDPRSSSLYAIQIARSYILVSNNLDELENVSNRLTSADNGAQALAGIHEWNDLSRHEFWGYRKYKHGEPRAIDRLFGGADQITPQAEAVILYVDMKKQTGVVRLFTSSADDTTARNINATGRIAPLTPVGPKVWETVFPLAEIGPFPDSAYWVWWLFGWGVLV